MQVLRETQGITTNKYYCWQRKVRKAACSRLARQEATQNTIPDGWMQITTSHGQIKTTLNIEINGCRVTVNQETGPELDFQTEILARYKKMARGYEKAV